MVRAGRRYSVGWHKLTCGDVTRYFVSRRLPSGLHRLTPATRRTRVKLLALFVRQLADIGRVGYGRVLYKGSSPGCTSSRPFRV